jgi:type VI secretion system protein ImpH
MADDSGPPPRDLTWLERLAADATGFDFYVALRRFDASFPERPRLGDSERPSEELVRIGQIPSTSFEPNELRHFAPGEESSPGRLTVGFLGLWGPNGPLPIHMTEYARDRLRHVGDATLTRFADVFHHRMLLLFYRAWAKAQPTVALDRPEEDRFALYLGALMGLGLKATQGSGSRQDRAPLHYAGLLGGSTRHADGLRDIVADHFGLPTRVEEFVGEWLDIPDDARWVLGVSRDTGTFGKTIVLGARVWSRTHKFRIVLGPLDARQFEGMLPGSGVVARLGEMVRLYTNDEWDWEIRLILAETATYRMRLGGPGRLGWTTRIGYGPAVQVDLLVDPVRGTTQRAIRKKPNAAHPPYHPNSET